VNGRAERLWIIDAATFVSEIAPVRAQLSEALPAYLHQVLSCFRKKAGMDIRGTAQELRQAFTSLLRATSAGVGNPFPQARIWSVLPHLGSLARRRHSVVEPPGTSSFVIFDDRSGQCQMGTWVAGSVPRCLPRSSNLLTHRMLGAS